MTRQLVAGNWKMHGTSADAESLARAIAVGARGVSHVDVAVCPPFVHLALVARCLEGSRVSLGAQNAHDAEKGAFTGEVSLSMLLDLGCTRVILGHSERRQLFLETDGIVHRKLEAAIAAGLTPIVCVGETEAEREDGLTDAVLERQVRGALDGLAPAAGAFDVAYEPVWAIGTGRTATPEIVVAAHATIRRVLGEVLGRATAGGTRILYGGSVKPSNAGELLALDGVDGALVGGASLEAGSFLEIAQAAPR